MSIFFNHLLEKDSEILNFSEEENQHIVKALRKKSKDKIIVTNGRGLEWIGELEVNNKSAFAKKISSRVHDGLKSNIEVAIAPTKKVDRIEWFLEKSTEIGINKIYFIKSKNSIRKKINLKRFNKILISAIKQSKQFYKPKISEIVSFNDFILSNLKNQKFIAHCQDYSKIHLAKINIQNNPCIVLIGPEGDFSKDEVKSAISNGFTPISLGENRLRTETAALVAVQTINTLLNAKN
ncbi:MAG: 16S rRNA (uracil(1498)-N(3))-methyltransferase [Flavobacteriales bacterium]|nr:16S rRNA (uracil(1498)-N(3))-methyltransferase [Flavobacteriales bacterium]